uniref:WGS project CBMF000000000 data, contig CS5834_c000251 n=1 Tax=Fusarium pseudograminearum CS5834 TaxID=1318459 RepID=A0A096PEF1_FUSPS|nr:unnamed protein product [Fusarium pseudograminearum CS5834]
MIATSSPTRPIHNLPSDENEPMLPQTETVATKFHCDLAKLMQMEIKEGEPFPWMQHLAMPGHDPHGRLPTPSDHLSHNAAQSVDILAGYGPPSGGDYAMNPEAHHDAYYNQPYEPHHQQAPLRPRQT